MWSSWRSLSIVKYLIDGVRRVAVAVVRFAAIASKNGSDVKRCGNRSNNGDDEFPSKSRQL
jgi:hypothetical protein